MYLLRFTTPALLVAACGMVAASPAQGGIILRTTTAREILDPIALYQSELVLTGLPGTFIQGAVDPSDRDYVTILDIPFLFDDVSKPLGWGSTIQNLGVSFGFAGGLPGDDPDLLNLTFSYGLPLNPIELPSGQSELVIGTFIWQTFDVPNLIVPDQLQYYWRTSRRLPDGSVIRETGGGTTDVQFIPAIPEPASLALTAAGLASLAALTAARRRRRLAG